MIKSMTGFGKSSSVVNDISFSVEIKAVNHRYFEVQQKITSGYGFLEDKIKTYLKGRINRGKLDIFVSINTTCQSDNSIEVNHALVSSYIAALREIASNYDIPFDVSTSFISKFNDVLLLKKQVENEDNIWLAFEPVLAQATDNLIEMKVSEGVNISNDLTNRTKNATKMLSSLEPLASESCKVYRQKLEKRITEFVPVDDISKQRILTEVAIFADKSDITEEIVRLRSHFEQFFTMLNSDESIGRKLDFLLQEMNREINTIGSKSSRTEISYIVVEIKSELEKIREQVQNIE